MRKIAAVLLALSLGGCASLQKVETAWQVLTAASVSPTQIIVAGNAFDAAEASATQYLLYCKTNPAPSACSLDNRQKVVAAVRSGRKARNTLEPYVVSGTAGPSTIFETLVAAITTLQAKTGAAK